MCQLNDEIRAMTISLQDLCNSAEQSRIRDLPLPEFTQYVYGATNSQKYMYIVKKDVPFNQIVQGQWVFTLSIASKDLERAWQIIAPRLFADQNGISSCEVYNLNYNPAKDRFYYEDADVVKKEVELPKKSRDGMQIILHSTPQYQSIDALLVLLKDVEALLKGASIQAGSIKHRANLQVDGSSYFYVRNQLKEGLRISLGQSAQLAEKEIIRMPAHNPTGAPNPYAYFNLHHRKHWMYAQKCIKNIGSPDEKVSLLTTPDFTDDSSYKSLR